MNEFVSWCRHLLVSFLFHALTSLHPPSFYRNDFSTCILQTGVLAAPVLSPLPAARPAHVVRTCQMSGGLYLFYHGEMGSLFRVGCLRLVFVGWDAEWVEVVV